MSPAPQPLAIEPPARAVRALPPGAWQPLDLGEMWHYRELLWFLTLRDIRVRYKQTALGALWAVLQPALTMVVFSLVFGRLAGIPTDGGIPYPIFAFAALLPWQLFAHALTQSSGSLVQNERLITRVYFPRLIIPLASVASGVVDFAISFVVLIAMMPFFGLRPSAGLLALPVLVLMAVASALAVGVWLSAWNVQYRDVRYTIPFLTQIWLFATPVAYPSSLIPDRWRMLYGLNPMAGVVDGFRWALLGGARPPGLPLLVSAIAVGILLLGGLYYFRRMERTFADRI